MKKIKINLNQLLGKPIHLSEKFHEKTKIRAWDPTFPKPEDWPREWTTVYFKEYPRFDKIILPQPSELKGIKLVDTLQKRHSERNFSKKPLTLDQLSNLLHYSAGTRKKGKVDERGNRFYPSPGARYPFEVYLFSLNSDLPTGIYHYNPRFHCLEILRESKKSTLLFPFNQDYIEKSGIVIVFTASFIRNTMKYGNRGYRYVLSEAGHLGQNFYLISTALGIGCCGIGGYLDKKIEELLDIDGVFESVVYALAVGNKK